MKEKDFIKLILTDKNIDHKKIKNNILSEGPDEAKPRLKRRPMVLAAVACALLLTVSAVSIPLMFHNNENPVLPPQSHSENSSAISGQSGGSSSAASPDRKVVYGEAAITESDDIKYPYGTFRMDDSLEKAMENPENEGALFAVIIYYNSEKWLQSYIQDSTEPDDFEIKQALNDYSAYEKEYIRLDTDFTDYYQVTIPKKIDFNTIPSDVNNRLIEEHYLKEKQIGLITDEGEQRFLYYNEQIRFLKEQVNAAKADEQARTEVIGQLDEYLNSFKTKLDIYYAAKEKFNQLHSARYTELLNEFFERNGLEDKEKSIKYGYIRLLLTKEEILSIAANDKEKVFLYLAPENPDEFLIIVDDCE